MVDFRIKCVHRHLQTFFTRCPDFSKKDLASLIGSLPVVTVHSEIVKLKLECGDIFCSVGTIFLGRTGPEPRIPGRFIEVLADNAY